MTSQWLPEIRHYARRVPVVLVGCKQDLREQSQESITERDATSAADEIGAVAYHACSAKTGEGIEATFTSLGLHASDHKRRKVANLRSWFFHSKEW